MRCNTRASQMHDVITAHPSTCTVSTHLSLLAHDLALRKDRQQVRLPWLAHGPAQVRSRLQFQ